MANKPIAHYPNEHKTLCGIEADKSRFGILIVNNKEHVTCKKCLRKLLKEI